MLWKQSRGSERHLPAATRDPQSEVGNSSGRVGSVYTGTLPSHLPCQPIQLPAKMNVTPSQRLWDLEPQLSLLT
jgi:hypothetical protein